ncbi:esterase-like activity of phytase family protein [Sulfurimonas sp.]|nr:esterase-like activity of phytase family protein [Sulfurimonas sp.]
MNIKILDTVALKFDEYDDIDFNEISALAYEKNMLYALSNRGYLYHLKIKLKKNKISSLKLEKAMSLKRKNSKRLKKRHRDAEGMVLVDNKLFISFEREPRVDVFNLNGTKIDGKVINEELLHVDNYQTKNKALESIAYNKKYGFVTSPELPLLSENEEFHTIYTDSKKYKFRASSNLAAMEFISKNKLLTLEKSLSHITRRRVMVLKEVNLKKVKDGIAKSRILAVMDSHKGWNLENFEGLTKVGKKKFLMISDDNRGLFDKTVLVLFKIK